MPSASRAMNAELRKDDCRGSKPYRTCSAGYRLGARGHRWQAGQKTGRDHYCLAKVCLHRDPAETFAFRNIRMITQQRGRKVIPVDAGESKQHDKQNVFHKSHPALGRADQLSDIAEQFPSLIGGRTYKAVEAELSQGKIACRSRSCLRWSGANDQQQRPKSAQPRARVQEMHSVRDEQNAEPMPHRHACKISASTESRIFVHVGKLRRGLNQQSGQNVIRTVRSRDYALDFDD